MKSYGWLGFALLLISEYCLFHKIEPFSSWFYCFAWWSYILLADNLLLKLRGRSLLTTRRAEFWRMLPLSVFIWLLFEGYNLRIHNWAYQGVESNPWIRWPGYALAFATVLPGVFITSDLMEYLFPGKSEEPFASEFEILTTAPRTNPSSLFIAMGVVLSLAPLVWPRYFFPAVWIGPIFLLDPLLERFGLKSLSLHISSGNRRRVYSLLLGGLACGLMWEFWNFWAVARWIYTVPFFAKMKVFEMPLLGFLGFPPFAIECWVLYCLLSALQRRLSRPAAQITLWLVIVTISAVLIHGIDRHTVLRFTLFIERSNRLCQQCS